MTGWEDERTVEESHDLAMEQAVLGAMMYSAEQVAHCLEVLTSRAFYRPAHQIVFEAISSLAAQGTSVDALTVNAELTRTGQISKVGGAPYLHTLLAAVPVVVNAPLYARRVLDHQARREADLLGTRVRQIAAAEDMTAQERFDAIYDAADEAVRLAMGEQANAAAVSAGDAFWESVGRLEAGRAPGTVQFPFADLRALIPWMRPGQLISIGARPSLGKSVLGLDIVRYAGFVQGLSCVLFTLEMARSEVTDRLLAAEAGVPLKCITDGDLTPRDWQRIEKTSDRFAASKLVIDDTPHLSLAGIRARLRAMRRTDAAQVAVVDYLQLMDGGGGESRQREVSALVAGLKAIAREFEIPVVMLFQLNRGPEGRADKRPYMSDARESGAVENDSDVAILIHREDHYDRESGRPGEADLIVDKNRNGPRATITVAFQGEYARFVDLAHASPADEAGWGYGGSERHAS